MRFHVDRRRAGGRPQGRFFRRRDERRIDPGEDGVGQVLAAPLKTFDPQPQDVGMARPGTAAADAARHHDRARPQRRVEPAGDAETDDGAARRGLGQRGAQARPVAAGGDHGDAGTAGDARLAGKACDDEDGRRGGHIPGSHAERHGAAVAAL